MREDLENLVGREIVVDTDGPLIYIGTLNRIGRRILVLENVDVHDMRDGQPTTTREVYIMQSRKHGIQVNRDSVIVPLDRVASVSLLIEVKLF